MLPYIWPESRNWTRVSRLARAWPSPPDGGFITLDVSREARDQRAADQLRYGCSALWAVRVRRAGERHGKGMPGGRHAASGTGVTARMGDPGIVRPHSEGKLDRGPAELQVGDRLRVQLVHTDVERGFIDFIGIGGRVAVKPGS